MNRQHRRSAGRSGDASVDTGAAGATEGVQGFIPLAPPEDLPERAAAPVGAPQQRTSPRQFLHEVDTELRKVVWPSRGETINYASVVLITLILVMALIFGLDTGFSEVSLNLFK